MIWSSKNLSEALDIEVAFTINANQVQFNSQDIGEKDIFIALKGSKEDGHLYAQDAINKGAAVVIVSHHISTIPRNQQIIVKDCLVALERMARYKRTLSKAKFIAVTGSVGKTSTKEALKVACTPFGITFATRGTFNNKLGVLLNLASMPDNADYAIFEMGMNHEGELRELTKLVMPNIGIITSVSEAHLAFFDNVLNIVDAKCEIFDSGSTSMIAVLNIDNLYYDRMLYNLELLNIKQIYTFGQSDYANSCLKNYSQLGNKINVQYIVNGDEVSFESALKPEHQAKNFAAVFIVAKLLDLDVQIVAKELSQIELLDGRGKMVNAIIDNKKVQIICDHYNANPESLTASLLHLGRLTARKKMAIIGDMLELGEASVALHTQLAPTIVESGVQKVVLVGKMMQNLAELLAPVMEVKTFDNVDLLCEELSGLIANDQLILVKGSRGVNLRKIFNYFKVL